MSGERWQPVATVPKDGTEVLATMWWPKEEKWMTFVLHWDGEYWADHDGMVFRAPEYWMPLPEPPTRAAVKET